MKKSFLFWVLCLNSFVSFSQTSDSITNSNKNNVFIDITDTTIYTDVDSIAFFPGGRTSWINYVQNNLNATVGVENGARKGTYNVVIKFTVTKDGILKDFVPITKYKHGFEEEVIRILKLSPKWIPARKNGVSINSSVELLQVFVILKGR